MLASASRLEAAITAQLDEPPVLTKTEAGPIYGAPPNVDVRYWWWLTALLVVALLIRRRWPVPALVLDVPVMDGVEATRRVCAMPGTVDAAGPRVLILTTFDLDECVYAALREGASGFLLKDTRTEDLVAAVRAIAAGEAIVGPTVTRRLIDHFVRATPARRPTRTRGWAY